MCRVISKKPRLSCRTDLTLLFHPLQRTSSNAETLNALENHVKSIRDDVLQPVSAMDASDIPPGLARDVEKFTVYFCGTSPSTIILTRQLAVNYKSYPKSG
ncbi:hypothetical protein BV25DRAFT_980031 [Artomyces pyxidatus]|uniref:Uncharacterized protein n=1 Tax=Artomyces pyxidatus TaxID=48021 RepID=A0ACB8SWM5_9AGAM|nr:hypothetical protein BV25DRAFT_980031 [Artomyces pyxidatus]